MKVIHTLVSEGPTDANLIPIIDWTLREVGVSISEGRRADFWRLPRRPANLAESLLRAIDLYPCDILFVHRDSDKRPARERVEEIRQAYAAAFAQAGSMCAVSVVPVRMLEAWLCFHEPAIRRAAGNPNGRVALALPPLKRVEDSPDPNGDLSKALIAASELSGRRRKKFDPARALWRIVDHIDDFAPLRALTAFRSFEESIRNLKANNWKPGFYGQP